MKTVRIANGQGFWGDSVDAPKALIEYGKIDYLTLDYLAEVTLSVMQRQKIKDNNKGYAADFIDLINENFNLILNNKIKIITNAGGVNPDKCKEKIIDIAEKHQKSIKIAIVKGDDIFSKIEEFVSGGEKFNNLYSGNDFNLIKENVYSANVYIDSFSIAEALSSGADIVICGRISDPGLVVGPCIYEFGWGRDDFDKLASATVAGHILECGAQCTGGNHSKWQNVKGFSNIGYPIAKVEENGDFDIIKPENSGGLINRETVIEQILYELGDPRKYISPDVCVDFTSLSLIDLDNDCVRIENVKGFKPTNTFKVSVTYFNGYKASGQLTVSGPNAIEKAKLIEKIIWKKLDSCNFVYEERLAELVGVSSCMKDIQPVPKKINEVVLRLSVKSFDKNAVEKFSKEISPLITAGPPGITGFSEGRPKVREIIAFWPTLIDKKLVKTEVFV